MLFFGLSLMLTSNPEREEDLTEEEQLLFLIFWTGLQKETLIDWLAQFRPLQREDCGLEELEDFGIDMSVCNFCRRVAWKCIQRV